MWNLIRTRHKREPLGVRTYNEFNIRTSSNDLSNPASSVVKTDEFNGSYTNEVLECQVFSVGSIRESSFIDCIFPELVSLEIDRPVQLAFIRCRFPKLRTVQIKDGTGVFYACFFGRLHQDDVSLELFSHCRLEGLAPDCAFLYEGASELDW